MESTEHSLRRMANVTLNDTTVTVTEACGRTQALVAACFLVGLSIPLVSVLSIVTLCCRNSYRLDIRNPKRYYETVTERCFKYLWLPERWLLLELSKLALLVVLVTSLLGEWSQNAVSIVWCVFDVSVLLHLFAVILVRRKICMMNASRATVWTSFIYTVTVGVGYGTTLKFQLPSTFQIILKWCTAFCSMVPLPYTIWKYRKSPSKAHICNLIVSIFLAVWVIWNQVWGLICHEINESLLATLLYGCVNGLLICIIITVEGSVVRHLPELLHVMSAALCATLYGIVWKPGTQSSTTAIPHWFPQLSAITVLVNLVLVFLYDVLFYCKYVRRYLRKISSKLKALFNPRPIDEARIPPPTPPRRDSVNSNESFEAGYLNTVFEEYESDEESIGNFMTDLKGNEMKCPICCDSFREDSKVSFLDACAHHFHTRCIMQSMQKLSRRCPLCRTICKPGDIRKLKTNSFLLNTFKSRQQKIRAGLHDNESLMEPSQTAVSTTSCERVVEGHGSNAEPAVTIPNSQPEMSIMTVSQRVSMLPPEADGTEHHPIASIYMEPDVTSHFVRHTDVLETYM